MHRQVGEAVAAIAELDFPERWEGLVQVSDERATLWGQDDAALSPGPLLPLHCLTDSARPVCSPSATRVIHLGRQLRRQCRSPPDCPLNLQAVRASPADILDLRRAPLNLACPLLCRWKSQFASNALYSEILLVLNQFCVPYFELFKVRQPFFERARACVCVLSFARD